MLKVKNKIVSKEEIFCRNLWSQSRGLMLRRRRNVVMIFPQEMKVALHNFFVFYPIEVIVLDEGKIVIEIKEKFRPFTFWSSKNQGKYLIELGIEESKSKVKIGDKVKII